MYKFEALQEYMLTLERKVVVEELGPGRWVGCRMAGVATNMRSAQYQCSVGGRAVVVLRARRADKWKRSDGWAAAQASLSWAEVVV